MNDVHRTLIRLQRTRGHAPLTHAVMPNMANRINCDTVATIILQGEQ